MGPGRWGSRGDIKLGVNVTYSDINNTSMLIEIAKQKGSYVPDLSFGTHFFQDLVEASIRYLPLYPDDEDAIFNERFFRTSKNILTEVLPEFDFLQKYISVIDVPSSKNGKILKVLMNGDEGQGLAIFCESENVCKEEKFSKPLLIQSESEESHASWRLSMIKKLADEIDFQKYDIDAIYLEEQQGNHPVEMIVHNHTFPDNINELKVWLEGWNSSFSYMNFLKTGISFESILKITYLTDQDLQEKNEIAIRYNSIKDNLRLIKQR